MKALFRSIRKHYATWGYWGVPVVDPILAHIRLIRPTTRLWFDTLFPIVAISVLTNGSPDSRTMVLFVIGMNLIHIAFTILNDLQDIEGDRASTELLRSTRPIANGIISRRTARIEFVLTAVAGLALTWFISWHLTALCVFLCILLLAHELPPLRTQSRPILSPIAGVVGFICIMSTMVIASEATLPEIKRSMPYLLFAAVYLGLGGMLVKDIRDVDNDLAGGKETPAVRYGAPAITRLSTCAYALAAAFWGWFIWSNPGFHLAPLLLGLGILSAWIVYTIIAANLLAREFSKALCVSMHTGSILVLVCLNLCVLWSMVAA